MKDRSSREWVVGLLVAAGCCVCILGIAQFLFDPLSQWMTVEDGASARADLEAARERWRSRGTDGYTIDVEGVVPLSCMANVALTVREGDLAAVESRGMLWLDETPEVATIAPEHWDSHYNCDYREMLIPAVHTWVERALDGIDWSRDRVVVEYDPEYGYVTEYRYTCCYRKGLFSPACSDCNVWFTFDNFEPITDLADPDTGE